MSPKVSRGTPGDEPVEPDLPPGHVRMSRPKQPEQPVSWWWKSAGLIALFAASATGIWLVLKGPPARETPDGTAELIAESLTDADADTFRSYHCDSDKLTIPEAWTRTGATTVVGVSSGYSGTATVTLAPSQRPELDLVMLLSKKDDEWCVLDATVCPHYLDAPSASGLPGMEFCRSRPRA